MRPHGPEPDERITQRIDIFGRLHLEGIGPIASLDGLRSRDIRNYLEGLRHRDCAPDHVQVYSGYRLSASDTVEAFFFFAFGARDGFLFKASGPASNPDTITPMYQAALERGARRAAKQGRLNVHPRRKVRTPPS